MECHSGVPARKSAVREYRRYFRAEECVGLTMLHLSAVALYGALERLSGDADHKGQGRLEKMGVYGRTKSLLSQIRNLEEALLDTEPDIDHRDGIIRKVNTYQLELKPVPQAPKDYHIITGDDMEMLVRPALDNCALSCPCLITKENGDTEVLTDCVRTCETRKMFKRILLSEEEGGFCPYYGR